MSLITVVIPVHEAHRSLVPRALKSIYSQIYIPDVLIVNDSTSLFTIGGATIIDTGGNKGSAYARNLGLDHVRTPLVFFLDADDYLLDTALETLLQAYLQYDECYVYSDWYQYGKNGDLSVHKAKGYDRKRLLKHSLHLVNILIATDTAKSVYYDINYKGWEDWKFHIELALKGYCGARVPEPLLIYDMTTSQNREKHNLIQDEVYTEILVQYDEYLKGAKEFMACSSCGSNRAQIKPVVTATPPAPVDGFVVMEYTGQHTAPVNFKVSGRLYRGAQDDSNKFIQVLHQDVEELMSRGPWRRVVKSSKPVEVPTAEEFNQWRQTTPTLATGEPAPTSPADWRKVFEKNAEVIQPKGMEEVKQKRHRRTKAEMELARAAEAA